MDERQFLQSCFFKIVWGVEILKLAVDGRRFAPSVAEGGYDGFIATASTKAFTEPVLQRKE